MAEACTALGVAKYGKPLGLDAKLKVDLIVIGSVAVDPKTGARLGKGEVSPLSGYANHGVQVITSCNVKSFFMNAFGSMGQGFAELEYGMLRHMGAIDDSTLVVTSGKYSKNYSI